MAAAPFTEDRLGQHLFHALCAADAVELPGWGVFTVKPYGADIQLVSGLFLPPARRVSFRPDATVSGDAFIRQVASVEDCSVADAARSVNDLIRGWRVRLDRGERVFVEAVGAFSLRNGFQWVFQPTLEANFLPESYGLPIYRLPILATADRVPVRALRTPVSSERGTATTTPAVPPADATLRVNRMDNRSVPIDSDSDSETVERRRIRSNREKWLAPIRSAAVFTGVVGLLVVGGTKPGFQQDLQHVLHEASWVRLPKLAWPSMDLFSQPPYEDPAASPKEPATQPVVPAQEATPEVAVPATEATSEAVPTAAESAKTTPEVASAVKKVPAPKESPAPEPAAPVKVDAAWAKPTENRASKPVESDRKESSTARETKAPASKKATATASKDRYYLVVGAFGDRDNAQRLVDRLKSEGRNAQLVPTGVGTVKVAADAVGTEKEAYALRESLKKSFPAVWVFRGNPQP